MAEDHRRRWWPWLLLVLPLGLIVLVPVAVVPRVLDSIRPSCPAPPPPPAPTEDDLVVLSPQWVATNMVDPRPPPGPPGFLFTGSAPLDAVSAAMFEGTGTVEGELADARFVTGYQFSWKNGATAVNFVVLQFASVTDAAGFEWRRRAALCPDILRTSSVPGIDGASGVVLRRSGLYLHRMSFQRGTRQHYFYVYDPAPELAPLAVADLVEIASPAHLVPPPPSNPALPPSPAVLPE